MAVPRGSLDRRLFRMLGLVCALYQIFFLRSTAAQTAQLSVDASPQNIQMIPENMFGIFFEVRLCLVIGACIAFE
jgi:alpha-N-arabinofuranosidase